MVNLSRARLASLLFLLAAVSQDALASAPFDPKGAEPSGSIMGTVYDQSGKPLVGAIIVILRQGAEEITKQARTGANGRFVARLAAGTYSLRAAADGFNPVAFESVQITPSSELVYRFNLEPIGSGRTAPERRIDRNETKWRLRAAQSRRSVFQVNEGADETIAAVLGEETLGNDDDESASYESEERGGRALRAQGVVETFAAVSSNLFVGTYAGLNFAVSQPVSDNVNFIFAGQLGAGEAAPQRFEATAQVRIGNYHDVSFGAAGMRVSGLTHASTDRGEATESFGQASFRVLDKWAVREGVILVLGMDYSRFIGAGSADAFSPRIGFQYDLNGRTRVRAAYAPGGDNERAQSSAQFEDGQVIFREARRQPLAYAQGQPLMEKSRRLEMGIEREIDLNSSIEATAFFDTTENRGVGLLTTSLSAFAGEAATDMMRVAQQQGTARGLRVLYSRRLSPALRASAGYSFGRGQALSADNLNDPATLWTNGYFQTAAAQVDATLSSGTRVRTIFRFSPRATVFAIDPFAGRLAVYDPSLSFYVTQELPTFGLPVRAEAVIDARNLLDSQAASVDDSETALLIGTTRRSVRGGISLRF